MRGFGVEEELLLVDGLSLEPAPAAQEILRRHEERGRSAGGTAARLDGTARPRAGSGHALALELQREQLEVVGPPRHTLAGQVAAIRAGRALADAAAREVGARVVALATPVSPAPAHLVDTPRFRLIEQRFGILTPRQLTCGFHVHVAVESREEGVAVLDRIRVWLPVLVALSANSPFWYGTDTGFASFRYQAWSRWPTAGPSEVFGSVEAYDRLLRALLSSGVPLDDGMIYFDARLSSRFPTVEVRVTDVCLEAEHAGVLAALVRALVETASRQWRAGAPAPPVGATELRAWSWRASKSGAEVELVDPGTGGPAPAEVVVARLLRLLRPVLADLGEEEPVAAVVAGILRHGSGARRQRAAYAVHGDVREVVRAALELTHRPAAGSPAAGAA